MNISQVPADKIVAGNNDRQQFGGQELAELAASIKTHGLAQPPTLRPHSGQYQIVAGERRVRAMRDVLGWAMIPAIIREMSDTEASAVMLAENVHRVDLDPMEEARAYGERMAMFDASAADVAELANVPVSRVRSRLALLSLCDAASHLVATRALPLRFAACMTNLDVNRQHLAIAAWQTHESMGFSVFAAICSRLQSEQDQEALFDLGDFLKVEEYVTAAEATVSPSVALNLTIEPVGQLDIAKRLGVQRTTVVQWIQRGIFDLVPPWSISDAPAWNWCDVEQWAKTTGRLK